MLLASVVAGLAALAVGFAWYSPSLFGKTWMKLSGISQSDMEKAKKKGMLGNSLVGWISMTLMAYVLAKFMNMTGTNAPTDAVQTAALIWLGFVATILLGSVLWERKSLKLYFLNALQWLVAMVVMALILGLMI